MNRHQVLTGAVNSGDYCHAVGYVEGVPFVAYGAGCDVVILSADFQRVQIIPGATHGNVQITCLDCSQEFGKIAASYGPRVCIFEPLPNLRGGGETNSSIKANAGGCRTSVNSSTLTRQKLDYKWQQTGSIDASCHVTSLSWNLEGTRLLTAGQIIQMWFCPDLESASVAGKSTAQSEDTGERPKSSGVVFTIGSDPPNTALPNTAPPTLNGNALEPSPFDSQFNEAVNSDAACYAEDGPHGKSSSFSWSCLWQSVPASPVFLVRFSPDGSLFASVGSDDRLVKIWYEQTANIHASAPSPSYGSPAGGNPCFPFVPGQRPGDIHFSFIYVAHPRAVTGFQWRRTSKYMPRGSVANVLVTSSKDNICRLWAETILPEDNVSAASSSPSTLTDSSGKRVSRHHINKHKGKMMARLKHIRNTFHGNKNNHRTKNMNKVDVLPDELVSPTEHDLHKFGNQSDASTSLSVGAGFHFHLAATINPETDIPLLPNLTTNNGSDTNFIIQWLNNKEMFFTLRAEQILVEMSRKALTLEQELRAQVDRKRKEQHMEDEDDDDDDDTGEEAAKKKKLGKSWLMKKHTHLSGETGGSEDVAESGAKGNLSRQGSSVSVASNGSDKAMPTTPHPTVAGDLGSSDSRNGSGVDDLLWAQLKPGESLDLRIEALVRDWHESADMLFSIHPLDGSLLVWLVDYLDEYIPGSYRQAQVSFSSQIPGVFPLADAFSMSFNLLLYCSHSALDLKSVLGLAASPSEGEESRFDAESSDDAPKHNGFVPAGAAGNNSPGQSKSTGFSPNILLLSKHTNGSLNQWQLNFGEDSKFCTVLSVAHASRACGHRFRLNDVSCHPVFPLLLSTSHHNQPNLVSPNSPENQSLATVDPNSMETFCSELILWTVEPVGPLSKSGGIEELARINSPNISAFANVAWVPTLLPSHTLGSAIDSPSACFIASDGSKLRMYQALIDARSLLMDLHGIEKRSASEIRSSASSVNSHQDDRPSPVNTNIFNLGLKKDYNIVSMQSTARPGCIIELDALVDSQYDWQNTQLLHAFQEQMIMGRRPRSDDQGGASDNDHSDGNLEAIVDLRNLSFFRENFYLVLLEKRRNDGPRSEYTSYLHMWKIVLSSSKDAPPPSRRPSCTRRLNVSSTRVYSSALPLPEGIHVVCCNVAAGHLSSSSLYPGCFAPYLLATGCSDGTVRFWNCQVNDSSDEAEGQQHTFEWVEWEMFSKEKRSAVDVPGYPIAVSCAYTGKFTVAYRDGSYQSLDEDDSLQYDSSPDSSRTVHVVVAIYECESTGGSEWNLEDAIHFKNIRIPKVKELPMNLADFMVLKDRRAAASKGISQLRRAMSPRGSTERLDLLETLAPPTSLRQMNPVGLSPSSSASDLTQLKAFPSLSALHAARRDGGTPDKDLKRAVQATIKPKQLVHLDWASVEDGSYVLTVGVGSKIVTYAVVSAGTTSPSSNDDRSLNTKDFTRGSLSRTKTLAVEPVGVAVGSGGFGGGGGAKKWMVLRTLELSTADALPPLPVKMAWVRNGLLILGMDNEMQVYSQWKAPATLMHRSTSFYPNLAALGSNGASRDAVQDDEDEQHRRLDDVSLSRLGSKLTPGGVLKASPSLLKLNASISTSIQRTSSHSLFGDYFKKRSDSRPRDTDSVGGKSADIEEDPAQPTYIDECGLFEAAKMTGHVLPQYHPKQLLELMNSGKVNRVKAILAHLVRCVCITPDGLPKSKSRLFSGPRRSLADIGASGSGEGSAGIGVGSADFLEIDAIPPLPLFALLTADDGKAAAAASRDADGGKRKSAVTNSDSGYTSATSNKNQDYSSLFASSSLKDDIEDFGIDENEDDDDKDEGLTSADVPMWAFGEKHVKLLTEHLARVQLPGLTSLDQMYLVALADVVASIRQEGETLPSASKSTDPVDAIKDCGLRFLAAMRHHSYLLRTLPMGQRAPLKQKGLSSANIAWAFHSEAEEELLSLVPCMQKGSPRWSELREFKIAWWVRNNNSLRRCIEKVAKAAYQKNKDPLDAAVFYLAMKKKNVLWGLFRSSNDEKMTTFFRNNFSEDRWRKAALKNAFTLMSKQRFEHAAAFFLLAGALKDAIEVCLNKLKDLDLAMVLARLYEDQVDIVGSVTPHEKRLLYEEVLGCDAEGQNFSLTKASRDPFKRSMAYWLLKDYTSSLETLLETDVGRPKIAKNHEPIASDMEAYFSNPSVFYFYNYLRAHPLILKQQQVSAATTSTVATGDNWSSSRKDQEKVKLSKGISAVERRLYFMTAHVHFSNGCPSLALEVLSKLPLFVESESSMGDIGSSAATPLPAPPPEIKGSSDFDWSSPEPKKAESNGFDAFDWSAPVGRDEPHFELKWSDEEEEEDDDLDDENKDEPVAVIKETVQEEKSDEESSAGLRVGGKMDIMAQQLKFISCLRILMEELSTLATGFEADGGQLRYYLYIWLDKEVEALKNLCGYRSSYVSSEGDSSDSDDHHPVEKMAQHYLNNNSNINNNENSSNLHELILAEKFDLEAKMLRLGRRKRWLTSHAPFLRTLLSYCSLHGADGGGLASVRMELILLLQELQQEKPSNKLLNTPLPFPTTLPLLSASVAASKTVPSSDPIRYLENLTRDILHSIVDISLPPGPSISTTSSLAQGSDEAHFRRLVILRNLGCALSACIYQCLSDSDSFSAAVFENSNIGMEGFTSTSVVFKDSYLMAGSRTRRISEKASDSGSDTAAAATSAARLSVSGRKLQQQQRLQVTSQPSKWPGIQSLRLLLSQDKDSTSAPLNVLLCEAAAAVYLSLLVHSLSTFDPGILYRLVTHPLSAGNLFSVLFGGGCRRQLSAPPPPPSRPPRPTPSSTSSKAVPPPRPSPPAPERPPPPSPTPPRPSRGPTVIRDHAQARAEYVKRVTQPPPPSSQPLSNGPTSVSRSRDDSHVSDDGGGATVSGAEVEQKPTFQETFVPPEISMINYFLSKPPSSTEEGTEYDSEDEDEEATGGSDFLDDEEELGEVGAKEHLDPQSYSWCLLRYVIVRYILHHFRLFLPTAGLEVSELAVASPLLHGLVNTLEGWGSVLLGQLETFTAPPPEYIPQCYVEPGVQGPNILKYKAMLDPNNTPFSPSDSGTGQCRRLWHFLVRQQENQEIFIRYIFKKKAGGVLQMPDKLDGHLLSEDMALMSPSPLNGAFPAPVNSQIGGGVVVNGVEAGGSGGGVSMSPKKADHSRPCSDAKIIHKEQETIPSFCLNRTPKSTIMAFASEEYLQEIQVTSLLKPEENYIVIDGQGNVVDLVDQTGNGTTATEDFLGQLSLSALQGATGLHLTSSSQSSNVILKRGFDNVRQMASHPHLPYYLSGGADGSVHVWEWGHHRALATPRPGGSFPKVTRLRFNAQADGNKFGVSDSEGGICLFHMGLSANATKPFYSINCHSKTTSDFAFVGSSSLLASAGHSSDGCNVCLWDTLLPHRSAKIQAFSAHEGGCPCLVYSPKHQVIISGGQKGDICIFDLRQNQLRHTFQAHDSAIKCLTLDPTQETFATGGSDGDIRVWGFTVHNLIHDFPGEHVQSSSFFRQGGAGISQLALLNSGSSLYSDLISTGADGSIKVRHLYY